MIFIDTNYFARLIVQPQTIHDPAMIQEAARLFRAARSGAIEITTSDAVLGEVFYVLSGPTYGIPKQDIARALRPLITVRGMRSDFRPVWVSALTIIESRPSMKFVDALAVSYSLAAHMELATFDRKLSRFPGITLYRPDPG